MNLKALKAEAIALVVYYRPYLRPALTVAAYLLFIGAFVSLLQDIEYYEDENADKHFESENQALFYGTKIKPEQIRQGHIFDCRFLATVAAFTTTDAGQSALHNFIKEKSTTEGYSVYFPGLGKTVEIGKLTAREIALYARTRTRTTGTGSNAERNAGLWLPVLEKAYGTYRNQNLDLISSVRRFCRHTLFEGRPTSQSVLPGFGAAYGACDDYCALALTGRELKEFPTHSFECGEYGLGKGYATWRQLRSWVDTRGVLSEFINAQDLALKASQATGGIAIATTELNGNCAAYGLKPAHAYAVLAYDEKKKILRLKDPYGRGDLRAANASTARDGIDDGIFEINLIDFNYLFSHLRVSR